MKTHVIFLVLLGSLLVGCASPNEEYGNTGIIIWGIASYVVNGYDTVKDSLMKHGYAAPGTTSSEFKTAIEKIEKISSVPADFDPSPNFATDHSYLFKYEGRKAVFYGRFVQDTNYQPEFDPTFSAGEITNVVSFVAKLKTPSEPVSAFLMSRFSESARQAIADFPESRMDEKDFDSLLMKELNSIILGPSIYDEDRFREVTLRFAARELLKHNLNPPPGMRITRQQMTAEFNRKLLEDAYPSNFQIKREHVEMRRYVAIKY
jgi:hypothetical protein